MTSSILLGDATFNNNSEAAEVPQVLSLDIVEHIEESRLTSNFPLGPSEFDAGLPRVQVMLLNGIVVGTDM